MRGQSTGRTSRGSRWPSTPATDMDRRSSIGLGDLARAVRTLEVRDPADVARIAALLGLVEGGVGPHHPSPSATTPAGGGTLRPAGSAKTAAMPGALTPVRPADGVPSLE